jgi:hypothetical protein
MDRRDSDFQVPVRQVGDAAQISRRSALIGIGTATAAILGAVVDRTLLQGVAAVPLPSAEPAAMDVRLSVDLRPVKPYDWVESPFAALGGRTPAPGVDREFIWHFVPGDVGLSVPSAAVEVVVVALPAAAGQIADAALITPVPMPIERLRDMGFPTDLQEIETANGRPTSVGDLWVFLPRHRAWPAGDYRLSAKTNSAEFNFSFRLTG